MSSLLSAEAVALRFGVSVATLTRWVRDGHFPAPIRVGGRGHRRWPPELVDQFEAEQVGVGTDHTHAQLEHPTPTA